MTGPMPDRIAVEFSTTEATLTVAALRQFEPFWPSGMEEMGRAELLAGIREGIEHIVSALDAAQAPAR